MNGKKALLDSNIIIYLSKQELSPDFIESFSELFISVVTYIDKAIADTVIKIRKKKKIKLPDAIIAGTALRENIHLITRNISDFKNTGVKVIDPFKY